MSIVTCHPPSSSAFTGTLRLTHRLICIAPIRSLLDLVSLSSYAFNAADREAAIHTVRYDDLLKVISFPWACYGLFISSFLDGIVNNPAALDYLKMGLAQFLASKKAQITKEYVQDSVLFSPYIGQNVDPLNAMEKSYRIILLINYDGREEQW